MIDYDLAVIGAGPGGYVAAIRAAQLGLKVACIDERDTLGGTCLNVGCMPSKALLHSTHLYEEAGHGFAEHGLKVAGLSFDLKAMMAAKDKTVAGLTDGIAFLFKKNKVTWLKGRATIMGAAPANKRVRIKDQSGKVQDIAVKNILIATGSIPTALPGADFDEKQILSSTGALALEQVPAHLIVIGGGVIGLELGSVWRRLGAKVTVIEYADQLLAGMDGEIRKQFGRIAAKQGMTLHLSRKVTKIDKDAKAVTVHFEPAAGGASSSVKADAVLVSVGRKPYTDNLGLETVGIALDPKGRIPVGQDFETSVPGIYAIGDVIEGPMLAHKAEDEGVAVAENIAGLHGHVNHDVIPSVVYTAPEIASVGKTEEELKAQGIAYRVGKFPFMANSRAKANRATEGFVKILADTASDRVLGVHIIGMDAGNMIAEAALAMEFGASAEDIALTCHAHPTETEAMKEAALAVHERAIHI